MCHAGKKANVHRSAIAHGESVKRGCKYNVIIKRFPDDESFMYIRLSQPDHKGMDGQDCHPPLAAQISPKCRDYVYS